MKWLNEPSTENVKSNQQLSAAIICFANICYKRGSEGGPCHPLCYIRQCITKFSGCYKNT